MWIQTLRRRYRQATPSSRLLWLVAGGLTLGLTVLPLLIFIAGSSLLGRYEGASLANQYGSIYRGLVQGNWASWIVVLGPALLVLLSRALASWWRRSAQLAR